MDTSQMPMWWYFLNFLVFFNVLKKLNRLPKIGRYVKQISPIFYIFYESVYRKVNKSLIIPFKCRLYRYLKGVLKFYIF